MRKKKYIPGVPEHICQRTYDRGVIFYRDIDYLVLFTIICVVARKHGISFMLICFMINHLHLLIQSALSKDRSRAVDEYTSMFSKQYNHEYGRKGELFKKEFGRAPKVGDKKIRTCLAYVANNPVEKKICERAENYRWNFLAYYNNAHPFSEAIDMRMCSKQMKQAIATVDRVYDDGNYLRYEVLNFIFKRLSPREHEQLVDYIITKFNFIDYDSAINYFGSYEKMVAAFQYNTGSEYDLAEDWDNDSDLPFADMKAFMDSKQVKGKRSLSVYELEHDEQAKLSRELFQNCNCNECHIHKYLHISVEEVKKHLGLRS